MRHRVALPTSPCRVERGAAASSQPTGPREHGFGGSRAAAGGIDARLGNRHATTTAEERADGGNTTPAASAPEETPSLVGNIAD
ncbi:MAG TPA: hypothetical protein VGJ84_02830 [Polyangiaceae bacterium]